MYKNKPVMSEVSRQDSTSSVNLLIPKEETVPRDATVPATENTKESFFKRSSRRCIQCLPKTRKGRWILGSSTLFLILVIIILALYFPRAPSFKLNSIFVANEYQYTFYQNQSNPNQIELNMGVNLDITVFNNNRYAIDTDEINLTPYVVYNTSALFRSMLPGTGNISSRDQYLAPLQVGFGKLLNYRFEAFSSRNITMSLNITYKSDPINGVANDPILGEIYQVCREGGNRKMQLNYNYGIIIGFLRRIGITPIYSDSTKVSCPFSKEMMGEIFKASNHTEMIWWNE
jgi:hypothetical protein